MMILIETNEIMKKLLARWNKRHRTYEEIKDRRHGDLQTKPTHDEDPTIAANARRDNQSNFQDYATMMRRHNQSTCQILFEITRY